jgi:CelD/BcsL family acetyltransferase involved in cellulose biosynthesis
MVWEALITFLKEQGIKTLSLHNVSAETTAFAESFAINTIREEKGLKTSLPATFEEFVQGLSKKHRHELRRKLRRLDEIKWTFSILPHTDIPWDSFFTLMREDPDKDLFLTAEMETFFQSFTSCEWKEFVEMGKLEIEGETAALALAFAVGDSILLYNSAYKHSLNHYAVGLMDKAFFIKEAINQGKKEFDFLNGTERFKYELGGQEYSVYRITLSF